MRLLVPHYDEMLAETLDALDRHLSRVDSAALLDVGGTGRLAAERGRARFVRASFFDPLPASDAVVASMSLRCVQDPDNKRRA